MRGDPGRDVVLTNIPFDPEEVAKWKAGKTIHPQFKAALRIDPLLAGNWDALKPALTEGGYPLTPEGCKQFLRDWWAMTRPPPSAWPRWAAFLTPMPRCVLQGQDDESDVPHGLHARRLHLRRG